MPIALECAFEALTDEEAFAALLDRQAAAIGAKGCSAGWLGRERYHMFAKPTDWSPEMLADYQERFAAMDPWAQALVPRMTTLTTKRTTDVVADATFRESAFYNEFMRPAGDDAFRGLAIGSPARDGSAALMFYRGDRQADFDERQVAQLHANSADIVRIVALKARFVRLAIDAANWRALVDRFAAEIIVIDARCRIVDCNTAARELLDRREALFESRGCLFAARPDVQARLEHMVAACARGVPGQVGALALGPGRTAPRLQILVAPNPGGETRIVLLGELPAPDEERTAALLCALYRLSPGEAAVMTQLHPGVPVDEVAARRGVSRETVRTQYRSALDKMDCRTLKEGLSAIGRIMPLRGAG